MVGAALRRIGRIVNDPFECVYRGIVKREILYMLAVERGVDCCWDPGGDGCMGLQPIRLVLSTELEKRGEEAGLPH